MRDICAIIPGLNFECLMADSRNLLFNVVNYLLHITIPLNQIAGSPMFDLKLAMLQPPRDFFRRKHQFMPVKLELNFQYCS